MADHLVVLVGAGASMDCVRFPSASMDEGWKPPLVAELFDPDRAFFRTVLDRYPLARSVAAEAWSRVHSGGGALTLENFLREHLYESSLPARRAMYWSVPLYLQDLLFNCGQHYAPNADNFSRLVTGLQELGHVSFVTLNYDTILETALANFLPIDENLNSYVSYDRQVFKLHGSVNWGREVHTVGIEAPSSDGYRPLCHGLVENETRLSPQIHLLSPAGYASETTLEEMRQSSPTPESMYYPALAVPLGPDDEIACPPDHVRVLKTALEQQTHGYGLHLLILGYSCLDKAPLELIKTSGNVIKSIVVVNGNYAYGEAALAELRDYLTSIAPYEYRDDYVEIFDGGFTAFDQSGRLGALVERVLAADPS